MLFLREHVGMPEPAIEQLRASPAFAGLVPLAQTAVYDNRLVASVSTRLPRCWESTCRRRSSAATRRCR